MSSSPGGSPEGGGGPPRSVLCCPGFVVPGPPAPMAGPGCGLAVLGPGRKRRRGGATLVASAAGRTCRILRLPPAGAGSPPAAGRLVARLEREVGAVALVPSEGGGKSGKGGEESADLFVADRSGRLWRSRGREGGGWEGGETRPGREPTEVRLAGCLPGPGRGSGRSLGRSGSRDRCLPLATDLLAAARLPSGEGGGTILVAAGSDALSPPSAILVPAGAEAGTEGVTVAVAAGEVPGLGDAAARTVASLVVPARSLGRGAWSSLVAAAASAGENPPPDGDAPCAAVLLGGEDGTVHCSFVAAAGGGEAPALAIGGAVPVLRLGPRPQAAVALFLLPLEAPGGASPCGDGEGGGAGPAALVCVGSLGAVAVLGWGGSSLPPEPPPPRSRSPPFAVASGGGLPPVGTWTSAAPRRPSEFVATSDDGSTHVCRVRPGLLGHGCSVQTTPLRVRREMRTVSTDASWEERGLCGMYFGTFQGSLLAMRDGEGETNDDGPEQQAKATAGRGSSLDRANAAMKQICDIHRIENDGPFSTSSGALDAIMEAMKETREVESIVSRHAQPGGREGSTPLIASQLSHDGMSVSISSQTGTNSSDEETWFQTCHARQPPENTKHSVEDLVPLWTHLGTKVSYAGATISHCTSVSESNECLQFRVPLWNRLPVTIDRSMCTSFKIAVGVDEALPKNGYQRASFLGGGGSKRKRELSSIAPVFASKRACLRSGLLGVVMPIESKIASSRISAIGHPFECFKGEDNASASKPHLMKNKRDGPLHANLETRLIESIFSTGQPSETMHAAPLPLMLSSSSSIVSVIEKRPEASCGKSSGLNGVSIDIVPGSGGVADKNAVKTLRLVLTGSAELDEACSKIPLVRSSTLHMLSERLLLSSEMPLSEVEAANLLALYHEALKNEQNQKKTKYLQSGIQKCILAAGKRTEEGVAIYNCDDVTGDAIGGDVSRTVSSAYRLYNQLRTIEIPLG